MTLRGWSDEPSWPLILRSAKPHVKHKGGGQCALHANGDDGACEDDGHGVVQDAFTKDEDVQGLIHVERLEDGQRCNGVDGGNERAEHKAAVGVWV